MEWIHTKNKIPDNSDNVLIYAEDCIFIASFVNKSWEVFPYGDPSYKMEDVNFWMPLPKAPQK